MWFLIFFFFKQKTAYEMRISDWSSDVCSSDLGRKERCTPLRRDTAKALQNWLKEWRSDDDGPLFPSIRGDPLSRDALEHLVRKHCLTAAKSEEHTSELQSLMRISYAVFCLKKKKRKNSRTHNYDRLRHT